MSAGNPLFLQFDAAPAPTRMRGPRLVMRNGVGPLLVDEMGAIESVEQASSRGPAQFGRLMEVGSVLGGNDTAPAWLSAALWLLDEIAMRRYVNFDLTLLLETLSSKSLEGIVLSRDVHSGSIVLAQQMFDKLPQQCGFRGNGAAQYVHQYRGHQLIAGLTLRVTVCMLGMTCAAEHEKVLPSLVSLVCHILPKVL